MGLYETLTSASARASEARERLLCLRAADYLHGIIETEVSGDGWVRPHRFTSHQRQALASCLAWHPGLYRQMSYATAGVCLNFVTDATEVALAVHLDEEPNGTRQVLAPIDAAGPARAHDGFSLVVDGESRGCVLPEVFGRSLPWMEDASGMGICTFMLDASVDDEGVSTMVLPGLGVRHEVSIWLPALRGCTVRELWCDGTYLEPVPERDRLLVLGDSIGQGFCADDPALAWPVRLAERMGLDLVNQSVGGQVFQPSMLADLTLADVSVIIVQLGENYRFEPCALWEVERDRRAYLADVARRWPQTPLVVVTPFWHDEDGSPTSKRSCWGSIPWMTLPRIVPRRSRVQMREPEVVDGLSLMRHDARLVADGVHPTAKGHAEIARKLLLQVAGSALSDQARLARARSVLAEADLSALPLTEALEEGATKVLFASRACVLAHERDGRSFVFGSDVELACEVIPKYLGRSDILVFAPEMTEVVIDKLGFESDTRELLVFEEGMAPGVTPEKIEQVLVLDESYAGIISESLARPDLIDDAGFVSSLSQGWFLGAFVDDKLVGFIGGRGAEIGALEVFRGYKRAGWREVLVAAKVEAVVREGRTPWVLVPAADRAQLTLYRKAGFVQAGTVDWCTRGVAKEQK